MSGIFSIGPFPKPPTIEALAEAAEELKKLAPPPNKHFERVTVSRWFPYKGKREDGTEVQVHGSILNGVLLCSQELFDYIKAETARPSEDEVRAARVRSLLADIFGGRSR